METLLAHKDIDEKKHDRFLQRCLTNTERLQKLLADVSLITRMDDGASSIVKEPVDLSSIVRDVVADRQLIAGEKGITIKSDLNAVLPMRGNASLLEAIFNNLIDNAIAYSGCSVIKISLLHEDGSKIVVSVADNGQVCRKSISPVCLSASTVSTKGAAGPSEAPVWGCR